MRRMGDVVSLASRRIPAFQHTLEKKPRPGRENPLGGDDLPNLEPRRAEPGVAKPKPEPVAKPGVNPASEPEKGAQVPRKGAVAKVASKKPAPAKKAAAEKEAPAKKTEARKAKADRDKAPAAEKPPKKKRRWIKRLLIWVPTTLVALVLLLAATLYFAGDKVFKAVWPTVDKKLAAKGIYVDIGSVEQTRERGLILGDVVG